MKAIKFSQFGPPDVVMLADVSIPDFNENEVLIKVYSAGVNPIDAKIRNGSSFVAKHLALPSGLGFDVCGVVEACGDAVTQFKPGDWVFGCAGRHDKPSTYAEYCVAAEKDIVEKPASLDVLQAGALPIAGLTAWQAVYQHGQIKKNEKVLVHAAAGGVGHLVVQLAKREGAYVIATASKRHHAFLTQLGVDEIIDYHQQCFDDVLHDLDLVIDLVGGETGLRSIKVLKSGGKLLTIPTITRDNIIAAAENYPISVFGMLAENSQKDLLSLSDLICRAVLRLKITANFQLGQAEEAHRLLEEGHLQGKLVLSINQE